MGRIQVIKSLAIPKILYRVTHISCNFNTLLYSFVWRGKDKVKRSVLINPIVKGGLSMPDIDSMIKTQRIMCIKRYLALYSAGWKLFLDFYLKNVGGKFLFHCNFDYAKLLFHCNFDYAKLLFHCNFDYAKLSVAVSDFYKECILLWSSLNNNNLLTLYDIVITRFYGTRNSFVSERNRLTTKE